VTIEFLVLDSQFHIAMADAAGNQVIAAMMAGRSVQRVRRRAFRRKRPDD